MNDITTPPPAAEETHHPYGPSRWPGLCACPGYAPSRTQDADGFAARGTAVHRALETGDYSALRPEDKETAEWMAGELAALTQGLDNVEREVKTCIGKHFVANVIIGITGTCDATWTVEDGSRHVVDFKAFSKIGVGDYRPQLAGYCLGLPKPENKRFVCHVFHGGSMQVETFDLLEGECYGYADTVAVAIEGIDVPPLARSPHCDHCAKAGDCAESAKVAAYGAMAAGRVTAEMVRADPAAAARLCDWLDAAAKRIGEAREIIAGVAKEGVAIADGVTGIVYGIQTREGRAQVPPVGRIIDDLIDKDGLTREGVLERATLTLTALRELVGKARAEEYAVRGEPVLCFVRKPGGKALKG